MSLLDHASSKASSQAQCLLEPLRVPQSPRLYLSLNFMTDLTPTTGNTTVLMVVDHFSKLQYTHCTLPTTATGLSPFHCIFEYQPPLFQANVKEVVVPSGHTMVRRCRAKSGPGLGGSSSGVWHVLRLRMTAIATKPHAMLQGRTSGFQQKTCTPRSCLLGMLIHSPSPKSLTLFPSI